MAVKHDLSCAVTVGCCVLHYRCYCRYTTNLGLPRSFGLATQWRNTSNSPLTFLEKGMATGWTSLSFLQTLPPPHFSVVAWEESYRKVWEWWQVEQTTLHLTGLPELQPEHFCCKSLCNSIEEYIYIILLCVKMKLILDFTKVLV